MVDRDDIRYWGAVAYEGSDAACRDALKEALPHLLDLVELQEATAKTLEGEDE